MYLRNLTLSIQNSNHLCIIWIHIYFADFKTLLKLPTRRNLYFGCMFKFKHLMMIEHLQ